MKSIFWFRRDLRLTDNLAFFEAVKNSSEIFPVFILDPQFLQKCPLNDNRLGFLKNALENLSSQLEKFGGNRLNIFYGCPEKIFKTLILENKIEKIFCAKSLSNTGKKRDKTIKAIIGEKNFISVQDAMLVDEDKVETRKVFSAFYRQWDQYHKTLPKKEIPPFTTKNFVNANTDIEKIFTEKISYSENKYWSVPNDIKVLNFFPKTFPNYENSRNNLWDENGITKISPYLRFGIISIREVFDTVKNFPFDTTVYQKELAWREFWIHIHHRFKETETQEFQEKRRGISWTGSDEMFEKWKNGETGYPIIDAAMKQLNTENFMHNRARMFTASFLTKNLHIDWRKGEEYFAKKLLDYDNPINIGNWQWSASVGADPKPLRIFSPVLQAQRFDPESKYIKKYLPELDKVEAKKLHDPHKFDLPYIKPIIDAKAEAKFAKQRYMNASVLF